MKLKLIALLFICNAKLFAQQVIELKNQDGVYISLELTKLSSDGDKKDKYLFSIKAENKNDYDVYYEVQDIPAGNSTAYAQAQGYKNFAELTAQNSVGFLSTGKEGIAGRESKYKTSSGKVLFYIPSKSSLTSETKFSFKKDEKPIVTCVFIKSLKKIAEFELGITESIVDGTWISNCGSITMTLVLTKNTLGEVIIRQTVNGKINEWRKINSITYEKITDKLVTLTYNKDNLSFIYTNPDGVFCSWSKK